MSSLGHNELTRRMINSAGHRSSHKYHKTNGVYCETSDSRPPQMTRFVGPTQDPPGSCRPHMGPMLAPWTLLSGSWLWLWEFLTNKLIKLSLTYFLLPTHKNIIQNTQLFVHEKSWWHHQMETFSTYWPFVQDIHQSPVKSRHKGQWRGALMFSLICT